MPQSNDGIDGDDGTIRVPGPEIDDAVSDALAREEMEALFQEESLIDAREYAERRAIFRTEQLRDAFHGATRWFVYFIALLLIAAIAVCGGTCWRQIAGGGYCTVKFRIFKQYCLVEPSARL